MIRELFTKPLLIFGCGNLLFGDDGFGPAVIEHLHQHHHLPETVMAEDVGTSIGEFLFDLAISPERPECILILNAVCLPERQPGEVFELPIDQVPGQKSGDFCMHQFPSVNLLRELRDEGGVDVRILAVQIEDVPEEVRPGLSEAVQSAIPKACEWLLREIGNNTE